MTHSFSAGKLFCVPYVFQREGETPEHAGARGGAILDQMVAHPMWFAAGAPSEGIREQSAWLLTHPEHWKWECWLGGRLVGMIVLSKITPKVDALLHFTFFGTSLFSARQLLWNFLGYAFEHLDLQRISFEAPEHVKGLVTFMREKLCFLYEGEVHSREHRIAQFLASNKAGIYHTAAAPMWVAKQGSRREHAHFDGKQWRDILLLRLLRSEWSSHDGTPGVEPIATISESGDSHDVVRLAASAVPDADPR